MSRPIPIRQSSDLEGLLKGTLRSQNQKTKSRKGGKGVIYTRVSSQEQAENNSSLGTQMKLCNEYAKRNSIEVKAYFGGTYESAKSDGRKEFQRMLAFVKRDPEISFIIVYNLDRFSRTGAGAMQLSTELRALGITVKSISQDIDNSTPSGRLQESLLHIFNFFDNDTKSERTSTNMREVMLKGYWPYATPLGYKNLKEKHRACDHQYVVTEKGKLIKRVFELKIEGKMTNKEICEEMQRRGLPLTVKNFRFVISNPFYAGYITGRLLKGEYVKGQHPPIITLEMFLKANDLLKNAVCAGIPKKHKQEEVPLKIFAKEEESDSPLTAFKQKGIWYYKARAKNVRMTINADRLNKLFEEYLKQFEYDKKHKEKLAGIILERLKERLASKIEESTQLKKRISEIKGQLEGMEERYVLGSLSQQLYEKYASKYREEIGGLEGELSKSSVQSSNLEKAVNKALSIAENVSGVWPSADYNGKQKLQYLLFPDGITYSKESGVVQTKRVNSLFDCIEPGKRVLAEKEKGDSKKNRLKSNEVIRIGFGIYCAITLVSISITQRFATGPRIGSPDI